MADMLRQVRQLRARDVSVETTSTGSSIYYGTYRREPSKQTGRLVFPEEFQQDIELIRSLSYGRMTPFFRAAPEMIGGDVGGENRQWHISNATGPLTLLVARFYNTANFAQRIEVAEQYCQLLREEGFPAYFEHQDVRSFVYVGDFEMSDRIRVPGGMWRLGPNVEAMIARKPKEFRHITDNGHLIRRIGPDGRKIAESSYLVEVEKDLGLGTGIMP
jgi:hypothetical protein